MTEQEALELAGAAWAKDKAKNKVVDPELGIEFAKILKREVDKVAGNIMGVVPITYKNHLGDIVERRIILRSLWYGTSLPWYPNDTWLMNAWDLDKNDLRTFALFKILKWNGVDVARVAVIKDMGPLQPLPIPEEED